MASRTSQHFWHVRRCSLFGQLDNDQLDQLERTSRIRTFARGDTIYLPSEASQAVFFLTKGRVRLSSATAEGKLAILGFIEPGEVFGELALVEPGPREERAEAMAESTIVLLSGESLQHLMQQSSHVSLQITKLMGFRRRQLERRLRGLLFRSNKTKLIMLIQDLLDQYGLLEQYGLNGQVKPTLTPKKLSGIKLSHQDLASLIGATRESVTHILGELQRKGIVQCGRQKILVYDLQALQLESEESEMRRIRDAKTTAETPP